MKLLVLLTLATMFLAGHAVELPSDGSNDQSEAVYQPYAIIVDSASAVSTESFPGRIRKGIFLSDLLTLQGGVKEKVFVPNHFVKSKFLPSKIAKSIPFSHDKLPEILNLLGVTPNSDEAKTIEETLEGCEESPMEGDDKHCATSMEDLVDFVTSKVGSQAKVFCTPINKNTAREQTIEKARKVSSGDTNIVCHKRRYPYAVFQCHTVKKTDVYVVSLVDTDGQKGKGVVVCHRDTSAWNPEHAVFKLLAVEPGVTICHIVVPDDMVWIPNQNSMPQATEPQ